jgi:hypothetical protein
MIHPNASIESSHNDAEHLARDCSVAQQLESQQSISFQ